MSNTEKKCLVAVEKLAMSRLIFKYVHTLFSPRKYGTLLYIQKACFVHDDVRILDVVQLMVQYR
jgi:hypothetical protein